MGIPYQIALELVERSAAELCETPAKTEQCLLEDAVGRTAAREYHANICTPMFDSSAMDGYAVNSIYIESTSKNNPCTLKVVGSVAAGDPELQVANEVEDGVVPCVEIMTGARFPTATSGLPFDTCVPIEHTMSLGCEKSEQRLVRIYSRVKENQHRRLAGEDFNRGHKILNAGEGVTTRHVMALASIGIRRVEVRRRVRVGIFSTGSELAKGSPSSISDANGPYLTATLRNRGAAVRFLGVLRDDLSEVQRSIRDSACSSEFDILISTGGVSMGAYDFIPTALADLGSNVVFHGVAMRPGHPVLFAMLPSSGGSQTAFFGLPGNPLAMAACLEALIMPFLRTFGIDRPFAARRAKMKMQSASATKVATCDEFRHGGLEETEDGWSCSLHAEQSSSKVRPFLESNCFVHLPPGMSLEPGAMVTCYPLSEVRGWEIR